MSRALVFLLAAGCSHSGLALLDVPDAAAPPPDLARLAADDASPDAFSRVPRRESCNQLDDDLDGKIDEGCPIRLTSAPENDRFPSLDGDRLVYVSGMRLLARDQPTATDRLLYDATGTRTGLHYPSLSGNRAAFTLNAFAPSPPPYVVIDLENGGVTTHPLAPGGTYPQRCMIEGSLLTWSQYEGDALAVYVRELDGGTVTASAGGIIPDSPPAM